MTRASGSTDLDLAADAAGEPRGLTLAAGLHAQPMADDPPAILAGSVGAAPPDVDVGRSGGRSQTMAEAPSLETDRQLLDAFKRGEREALSAVYRLHVGEVVRALRRGTLVSIDGRPTRLGLGISEGDMEVLVQDTFLRAFSPSARSAYDGIRPYGPYLVTIARNLLIDAARGRKRHQAVMLVDDVDDVVDVGADPPPDPTWSLQARELAIVVDEIIKGVSPLEQSIFRLRYREEKSQRQVSEELGLSLITVRRKDVWLRAHLLEGLRRAGYFIDSAVGIPSSERDRSRG
jgi:RNA polymerase sigma-70 factor (ECF subfamily)